VKHALEGFKRKIGHRAASMSVFLTTYIAPWPLEQGHAVFTDSACWWRGGFRTAKHAAKDPEGRNLDFVSHLALAPGFQSLSGKSGSR